MSYDLMFQKANALYQAGDLLESARLYRQILEAVPDQPDILNMLGLIAQAEEKHDLAVSYFDGVIRQRPDFWPAHFNNAVSLFALNKYKSAERAYRHVLTLAPNIKEASNNLGAVLEAENLPDEAEKYYRQALSLDPAYIDPAVNLAVLHQDTALLQTLMAQNPQEPLPAYRLAHLYFDQKKPSEAETIVQKALNLAQNEPDILLLAGEIANALSKKAQALDYFKQVLSLQPHQTTALFHTAVLTQDESLFLKLLDLSPDSFEAHTAYADFLYADKRTLEALEEYRKAVIINPNSPEVSNNLALILKDSGDFKQALDLFLNAFTLAPKNIEISQNIAQTLVLLSREDEQSALATAHKFVEAAPDNLWAIQTLAALTGQTIGSESVFHEQLFDSFADRYDQTMATLDYRLPEEIAKSGLNLGSHILDLGCGSGLAAQTLKRQNTHWTGVDISAQMLEKARAKNLYDKLIKADIATYLKTAVLDFDFIVALDVMNYFDAPEKLFEYFNKIPCVFSIENSNDTTHVKRSATGRYQHDTAYLVKFLKKCGYANISTTPLILRTENGMPVRGTLFVAR